MKKSYILSLILTLLFGPLGLFYSSLAGAIALTTVAIILGSIIFVVGALVTWPFSIIVGLLTVRSHNAKVKLEEKRHNEILATKKAERIEPRL